MYFGESSQTTYAQCGAEGLDACCGTPARACKKTGTSLTASAEASIRKNTEIIHYQREQIEKRRIRKVQLERINASETAALIKSFMEYDRKSTPLNLFPVEGFTPGIKQTTYFSLTLGSEECGRIDDNGNYEKCYMVNGFHFYFDREGVSDHVFTTRLRLGGMPQAWRQYGFDWDLSYNEWINLFKKLGYKTLATEKSSVGLRDGAKFFEGELTTIVKTPNGRMRIALDFTNGFGKVSPKDKGTLFSMVVDKIG